MVGRGKKKRGVPSKVKKAVAAESPSKIPSVENVDEGCPRCAKGCDSDILNSSKPIRCEDCRERKGRDCKGKGKDGSNSQSKGIWVCLECGRYVCGGVDKPNSSPGHAIRHQRQNRHHVFMQRDNPQSKRWCFGCGKETEEKGETIDVSSDEKEKSSEPSLAHVEETEEKGETIDISEDEKEQSSEPSLANVEETEQKGETIDVSSEEKEQSSEPSLAHVKDVRFETGSVMNAIKSEEGITSNSLDGKNGYVVRGLINLGNTCFFNSVMQNLLALDRLRDHFLNPVPSTGELTFSLKELFAETKLEMDSETPIDPQPFFDNICATFSQFKGNKQQDSHELLRCLLQELRAEELNVDTGNQGGTFVDKVFGGEICSTLSCEVCGHTSTKYEPFLDLSLSVPTKKSPSKKARAVSRAKKTKRPPEKVVRGKRKVNKKPRDSSGNLKEVELHGIVGDPEIAAGPNISGSDPDQVDDSDSPVSIKSCLAHFVKPEPLSDDNSWNCDKCAENLQKLKDEKQTKMSKSLISEAGNHSLSEPPDGVSVLHNDTTDSSDRNCIKVEDGRTSELNSVEYKCDDASLMKSDSSVPSTSCFQEPFGSIGNNSGNDKIQHSSSEMAKNSQSQESPDKRIDFENVKAKTKATKKVLITKAPSILTIHLKRISQNANHHLIKSNDIVVSQEIIDIRPYVQPSSCRDGDNYVYHLVGVVEHSGQTMSRGHYVAYVRGREKMKGKSETEHVSSRWYYVTDKRATPVSLKTVLDQQAYILFYEKI